MNPSPLIQYLPALELLIFNLFSIDCCCHRKYSAVKTALILGLFSLALFTVSYLNAEALSFRGDGTLTMFGFVFLLPLHWVYRESSLFYLPLYAPAGSTPSASWRFLSTSPPCWPADMCTRS